MSFLGRNEAETVHAHLQSLGVDTRIAERGRVEENIIGERRFLGIELTMRYRSTGVIDIGEGPIRWGNTRARRRGGISPDPGPYNIEYGVPDQRLTQESPKVQIESALVKKYLVGRIVDVYWRGKDFGLGVLERLNDDTSLRKPELALQVKIRAYPEHGPWILATATEDLPSVEVWNCYQAIARHLLDT